MSFFCFSRILARPKFLHQTRILRKEDSILSAVASELGEGGQRRWKQKDSVSVGDLVRISNDPSPIRLIVKVPSFSDQFYHSIAADGHTKQITLKNINYSIPSWGYRNHDSCTQRNLILSSNSLDLLNSLHLPENILDSLNKIAWECQELSFKFSSKFKEIYHVFHNIRNDHKISVIDAAKFVFHDFENEPSEAECLTVFSYMIKRLNIFQIPDGSRIIHSFNLSSDKYIRDLNWLEKEVGASIPGVHLTSFLDKVKTIVSWAESIDPFGESVPPHGVTFDEFDKIFIHAIKNAAFIDVMNPFTDLVRSGILERLPAYRLSKSRSGSLNMHRFSYVKLLTDIGVIKSTEDFTLLANSKRDSKLENFVSPWAKEMDGENDFWCKKLLIQGSLISKPEMSLAEKIQYAQEQLKVPSPPLKFTRDRILDLINENPEEITSCNRDSLMMKSRSLLIFPQNPPTDNFHKFDECEAIRQEFNLPVYVIDGPDAHELDDGISIEKTPNGTWLHIHIADPTTHIPISHPTSLFAQIRAFTMYLPHAHFPMIPNELSENLFSLRSGSYALTISALISSGGTILDCKITPSILKNVIKTTYRTVNNVVGWKNVYGYDIQPSMRMPWTQQMFNELCVKRDTNFTPSEIEDLNSIQEVTNGHCNLRQSCGAFSIDRPEYNIKVKNGLIYLDPQGSGTEPANLLVSECMIIANSVVSMYCHENDIPALYSCQMDTGVYGVVPYTDFKSILHKLKPAYYSISPANHSGLGIFGYVKASSPLRRYLDMLIHYNIKARLLNDRMQFSSDDMLRMAIRIKTNEKVVAKISGASHRYWALEWIHRREVLSRRGLSIEGVKPIGETFSGLAMPKITKGNRDVVIWSDEYRGSEKWGWPCPETSSQEPPIYAVLLESVSTVDFSSGIMADLGGIECQVRLRGYSSPGEIVMCQVETVHPTAGKLILVQR